MIGLSGGSPNLTMHWCADQKLGFDDYVYEPPIYVATVSLMSMWQCGHDIIVAFFCRVKHGMQDHHAFICRIQLGYFTMIHVMALEILITCVK